MSIQYNPNLPIGEGHEDLAIGTTNKSNPLLSVLSNKKVKKVAKYTFMTFCFVASASSISAVNVQFATKIADTLSKAVFNIVDLYRKSHLSSAPPTSEPVVPFAPAIPAGDSGAISTEVGYEAADSPRGRDSGPLDKESSIEGEIAQNSTREPGVCHSGSAGSASAGIAAAPVKKDSIISESKKVELKEVSEILDVLIRKNGKLKLKDGKLKVVTRKPGVEQQVGQSEQSKEAIKYLFELLEDAEKEWDLVSNIKDILEKLNQSSWARHIIDSNNGLKMIYTRLMAKENNPKYVPENKLFDQGDQKGKSFVDKTLLHSYRWMMSSKQFFEHLNGCITDQTSLDEKKAILKICNKWITTPNLNESELTDSKVLPALKGVLLGLKLTPELANQTETMLALIAESEEVKDNVELIAESEEGKGNVEFSLNRSGTVSLGMPQLIAEITSPFLPQERRAILVDTFAKDLNVIHSQLFSRILSSGLVTHITQPEKDPNISAMVNTFNQASTLFGEQILSCETIEQRVLVVEFFIDVAEKAKELGDLNTTVILMGLFENSHISRLKKTWATVSKQHLLKMAQIKELNSATSNYKNLRNEINFHIREGTSCVPYIGMYLQDLTFIKDGNIDRDSVGVNTSKLGQYAEIDRTIKKLQELLAESYVVTYDLLTAMKEAETSDQELYNRSLVLEPRETARAATL